MKAENTLAVIITCLYLETNEHCLEAKIQNKLIHSLNFNFMFFLFMFFMFFKVNDETLMGFKASFRTNCTSQVINFDQI